MHFYLNLINKTYNYYFWELHKPTDGWLCHTLPLNNKCLQTFQILKISLPVKHIKHSHWYCGITYFKVILDTYFNWYLFVLSIWFSIPYTTIHQLLYHVSQLESFLKCNRTQFGLSSFSLLPVSFFVQCKFNIVYSKVSFLKHSSSISQSLFFFTEDSETWQFQFNSLPQLLVLSMVAT